MLLLLLWLATDAAVEVPPGWRSYRDGESGFAVQLPGPPTRARTSQLTVAGRIPTETVTAFGAETEFRVEVHGIPSLARWILSERRLLERAAADFLADEGAVSSRATARRFGAHPALHLDYTDDQGRVGEARFVLAQGRLYLRVSLGPPGDPATQGRARFFDSFRLLPDRGSPR